VEVAKHLRPQGARSLPLVRRQVRVLRLNIGRKTDFVLSVAAGSTQHSTPLRCECHPVPRS
jgi:hypothetical protein